MVNGISVVLKYKTFCVTVRYTQQKLQLITLDLLCCYCCFYFTSRLLKIIVSHQNGSYDSNIYIRAVETEYMMQLRIELNYTRMKGTGIIIIVGGVIILFTCKRFN